MTKEAMKLALEALEGLEALLLSMGLTHLIVYGDAEKAITNLQEALASEAIEQPAQQDSTCSNGLRAQGKAYPRTCKKCGFGPCVAMANKALDKKAENARELGLDYEPAPATELREQEPVAKYMGKTYRCPIVNLYQDIPVSTLLYTSPPTLSLAQRPHECSRSHPHENMNAMCELRTEIARLTNENARLKAMHQDDEINTYRMTLLCIRDGLQQGMSKSIQKLQAREINDVLGLPSFASYRTSPPTLSLAQRTWVGLTLEDMETTHWSPDFRAGAKWAAAKLKEKNT